MTRKVCLFLLGVFLFVSSFSFISKAFAQSYLIGGNEIINKIFDDITLLKRDYGELASFEKGSLKKTQRNELRIVYGEPGKKDNGEEKTYIFIAYTKLPVSFKGWQSKPSIFYSLKEDLYFGVCLNGNDELRKDLLSVIERDVRE
ncbi:MAG: hypothetical protein PHP17_00925 [Candidatus Omnitrophica bacterium]|nr:hypothetical protein [Candidatus Omnitrophota bacterium]